MANRLPMKPEKIKEDFTMAKSKSQSKKAAEPTAKKQTLKLRETTTPNVTLTDKKFSGGKESVRACSEKCAKKHFAKKDKVKAEDAKRKKERKNTKPSEREAKSADKRKIAPRRQAIVNVIKKLKNPTMETILMKTPRFSDDPKKDAHSTSDTIFRMWKYDGLLKKDGRGKDAKYSFSAKGKKEYLG